MLQNINGINAISYMLTLFTEKTDTLCFEEKEKNYLFAIELTNSTYSMMNLAILYESKGIYNIAENYYLMSLELDKNDVTIRYNLADMYLKMYDGTYSTGSNDEYFNLALHHFSKAADLNDLDSIFRYIEVTSLVKDWSERSVNWWGQDEQKIKYLSMAINHGNYKKDYFTLSKKLEVLDHLNKLSGSLPENIIKEKNI